MDHLKAETVIVYEQTVHRKLQPEWMMILRVFRSKMSCRILEFAALTASFLPLFADPKIQSVWRRMRDDDYNLGFRLHRAVRYRRMFVNIWRLH